MSSFTVRSPQPQEPDPLHEFLRACARVDLDHEGRARLLETAGRVRTWNGLAAWAEIPRIDAAALEYARTGLVAPSARESKHIAALAIRHADLSRAQAGALGEIVCALDAAGIGHLVLKGAFLAHVLYLRPDLRPMGDLDILVAPADAARAQTTLRQLGFDAPLTPSRSTQRFHHHLPIATRHFNGIPVSVEIHRDALSGDDSGTLRLDSLSHPPREITVAGLRLRGFGHVDMLVHLCAHALQPANRTRLIAVADFVGYAARYGTEIDWAFMHSKHPRVVNALALMHYVTPLPASLRTLQPPDEATPPAGVGWGITPLGTVAVRGRGVRRALRDLLYPSEWWMHAYYGVPPQRSLFPVRWGRHLWRIVYWTGRRVFASAALLGRKPAIARID